MNRIVLVSLFLFAIVYSAVETSSVSVNASYKQGHVRFEVVDSNKESLSGLQVVVSKGDEPSMNAVFRNGAYEVDTTIPNGITDFNLRIRSQEGKTIFSDKVAVVSTVDFKIPSVSVTVDKATTEIRIPVKKTTSFSFGPKSSIAVKTTPETVEDFVPTTALLVIASPSKKISLPMVKNGNAFEISFSPSRKDVALPFDYEKGEYTFMILFGDCLLASPISLSVFTATVDFGSVPEDPVYPIYSKPLLYQSENSVKPLKEMEHVFKPENKNPFFLFPLSFTVAIIAMIPVLLFLFKKVGFEKKEEVVSKKIWKILFFVCITIIIALYIFFWIGWNMISLLKVLLPLAVCTAIVGNRAL